MTFRSVLIGLVLLLVAVVTITYNDYGYKNTYLTGGNHFPIVVVFVVVLFSLLINPLLRRLRPRWTFSQAEIVVIWCLMAAGVGIPASGLMRYLMPFMVAPFYFGTAESLWADTLFQYIPEWLVPSKDVTSTVVTMFYEGSHGNPIPWEAWVTPFFGWGVLIMASYLMMFCMTAIIRKQWVEHERLSFPLAQIPLQLSQPPEEGRYLNSLLSSPVTWVGAAIPIAFWLLAGLNKFYPNVPYISNVNWTVHGLIHSTFPGIRMMFVVYFMPIGVAFLLSTEVSLSLWLFFVLHNVQRVMRVKLGYAGSIDYETQQQVGGYVAFAAVALWTMRHHLRNVLRKAFLGARDVDDSGEMIPYRAAVLGMVASSAVILAWMRVIGCPLHIGFLFLCIVWVVLLVLARLVAQCGLLLVQSTFWPSNVLQSYTGSSAATPAGLTALTLHQAPLYGDTREALMPTLLNNAKMGEKRVNLRSLFLVMLVAVVLSYSVSYVSQIIGYYKFGAISSNAYSVEIYPKRVLDLLGNAIKTPSAPLNLGASGIRHTIAGGAAVLLVYFLRSRFAWWFVHPIGILTAQSYPLNQLWLSIFLGWLCKSIAQRYARGQTMGKVRRFFIGIIIGDALITIFWSLVGLIIGRNVGVGTFPG